MKIFVIGNKVEDEADETFIREKVGDSLIGCIGNSKFVRDIEKGMQQDIATLEPEHLSILKKVKDITDGLTRDWDNYREVGLHFHRQAAESWGNDLMKTDLMSQADPSFRQEGMMAENKKVA